MGADRKRGGPASHFGYWFGTHVAIDAGFVASGFVGGRFHHERLRLQV
jgi:hypothetical protein